MPQRPPQWLTVPQTARRTGLSERTIWSLIASGELRSIKVGSARRVPVCELAALEARLLDQDGAA
jgi:excisionase family DNA binding protein